MTRKMPTAVCIVVENLPVPLDRRVWREACALRDAGYRVSVICPKGKGFSTAHETLEGVEIYRHRAFEASTAAGYLLEYSWALIAEFLLTLKVFARTRFRILQACNPPDTIFLIGVVSQTVWCPIHLRPTRSWARAVRGEVRKAQRPPYTAGPIR